MRILADFLSFNFTTRFSCAAALFKYLDDDDNLSLTQLIEFLSLLSFFHRFYCVGVFTFVSLSLKNSLFSQKLNKTLRYDLRYTQRYKQIQHFYGASSILSHSNYG